MRRILVMSAVLALATVGLAPQTAMATPSPDSCPTNKPLVVDVSDTVRNAPDYGADGHEWALDSFTETIQIWRVGTNAYCVKRHDVGSFTTLTGPSPEGTGVVPAGVTGSWEGTLVVNIYGTFEPTGPTTGFIGDFDSQPSLRPLYFSRFFTYHYTWYHAHYDAGACGVWDQTINGDTGDIVC
jgi:hypothetical protein